MRRRALVEEASYQRHNRYVRAREAILIGALALGLAGCDLLGSSGSSPTAAPYAYGTPTASVMETAAPGPTTNPSETPISTATYTVATPMPTASSAAQPTTGREEVEAAGTYTYANYYYASSRGLYLSIGRPVIAECVLFVQNPTNAGEINAWYRLDSPSGRNGITLYARADTFATPGASPAMSDGYDHNLAVCPDSPLPPQDP